MYNTGMRVVSGGQYVYLMTFLDFALTIAKISQVALLVFNC